ncbi:MAG: acyl carrier protein [Aeromicrobium erythreum]|jgi:act minimal PKS acyl carrier protein
MPVITLDDVKRALVEGAGVDAGVDLERGIATLTFEELGYDSLAVLETGLRLGRENGVEIDDEQLADIETPQDLADAVNHALAEAAVV